MKSKLSALGSVLFLSALILGGCTPLTSQEASVDVSCNDFTKLQHISKEVEVPVDDSLTVRLCSNSTTGFQWSEAAQISDQTVLQQTAHEFLPPEAKNVVGGAGEEVWTFKALKEGKTELSMEYSRPGEGGEKAHWTFVLTVVVK